MFHQREETESAMPGMFTGAEGNSYPPINQDNMPYPDEVLSIFSLLFIHCHKRYSQAAASFVTRQGNKNRWRRLGLAYSKSQSKPLI